MGFLSAIGGFISALGRGFVAVVKGIVCGIAKIFTREWTVIDSATYRPITNKEKIFNDSRGRTPLDLPPVPVTPAISSNNVTTIQSGNPYSYGYGYATIEDSQTQQSIDFLKNLYRINPDVVNNPKYYNYDVNADPYHGYGTTFGPMFNPDLANRRYDMFGRPFDDTPLFDSSVMYNHPPMMNLNPFVSMEPPAFSQYSQNGEYVDSYIRNANNYCKMLDDYANSSNDGLSDMGRAYREHLADKEREMWSEEYIADLDKYIWEDDHGYSRASSDDIDADIMRRRNELASGQISTYIPNNYVGNARPVCDI